jgi:hypothetical protein
MTRSRFDPRLQDYQDPDEATLHEFWEGRRQAGHTTVAHRDNPACPDYEAHAQNAADRLFPGQRVLSPEQDEEVQAAADAEYRACEGH